MTELEQMDKITADVIALKRLLDKTIANVVTMNLTATDFKASDMTRVYVSLNSMVIELHRTITPIMMIKSDIAFHMSDRHYQNLLRVEALEAAQAAKENKHES